MGASIIVAILLLISSFLAIIVIKVLPRKIILITSIVGMSICYLILGGCFHQLEKGWRISLHNANATNEQVIPPEPGHIGWIAPLSICVLLFIGNGGYGALIWVVMAELLPPRVRATANAIVISKTFVDLIDAIHASGTFWLYGAVCLVGTLYTIFFVPETKGKTIEEIQQMFSPSPDEKKKRGSVA